MDNSKFKILIVEDEVSLQKALQTKLSLSGYTVITASDGQEGLDKIHSEKPDLILLDVIMPNKDGIAVLQELSDNNELQEKKIFLLTNLNDPETIMKATAFGVKEYIVKSDWDLAGIEEKIAAKLQDSAA